MATSVMSKVRTDEIFTSLLIQHGRKPVEDLDAFKRGLSQYDQTSETLVRKRHLRQYGQVSGEPVKHCREIFIPTDGNVKHPESILLTGKAGIGKTLFCQKLIRDWADGKLFQSQTNVQVPDFKFAYLLTFRQLNLLGDDRVTLREILNRSSVLDDRSNIDESLFEYIVDHADEVLIIIDGYDEYSQQDFIATNLDDQYPNNAQEEMPVAALCAKLVKGKILRGSSVMITSRPDESDKMKDEIVFDRYVEITGFSEQQVKEYIEKYFKENKRMKKAVIDHITKNDNLVSCAHIPVLCFLMCSYFEYILNESMNTDALPVKTSDLYFEVVNMFLQKHTRKKEISPEDTLDKLSELAAELLLEKRFLFVEEDAKTFTSEEVENLRASGLLHCGPPFRKSFSVTTKHFCFTHLTLQEYLAARWFVKRKEIPSRKIVSEMVVQFMSGILSKQNSNTYMEELLEEIYPSSDKPNGTRRLLTAKCLTEYQDTEFAKNIVKKRYHQLCGLHGEIKFRGLTAVDCTAVSFLLDVISALKAEEAAIMKQTISEQSRALSSLSISSSYLTQSGAQEIFKTLEKDFCAITNLVLFDCHLNDECVHKIGELLPTTKLTELFLYHVDITDAGVVSLCQALQTPTCKVTTLDLRYNQITADAGVLSLCQALQTSTCKVTTLRLDGGQITDAGVVSLCQALQTPTCKVTTLRLFGNHITAAGVVSLCQALKTPTCKVTTLDLSGTLVTDAGVVSLSQALQTPTCKVTTLHLMQNQITDAGVVSLCKALQTPTCKVTTLDLSGNQITDAGVVSLCQALQTPTCKVTTLHLRESQITDAGVVSLCQALKTPTCKVTTLHLSGNQITDAGVVSLCQALQTPTCKVTTLHLRGNLITNAGVVSLCQALQTATCEVTTLGLSENTFTDASVVSLYQALQTPTCKVSTLYLSSNLITDAGVVSLCQALQTPTCKVTTLHLGGNQITDAGVVSLCQALKTPTCKVTTLDLSYNLITDAGVVSLCQALQTATCEVTALDLRDNQISDFGNECIRNLLKQKPHLEVGV